MDAAVDLDSIQIEEPHVVFRMNDTEVIWYAEFGEGPDILLFARPEEHVFPMIVDGYRFGTTFVTKNLGDDGRETREDEPDYVCDAWEAGGSSGEAVDILRRRYPPDEGYVVAQLRMSNCGGYYPIKSSSGEAYVLDERRPQDAAMRLEEAAPLLKNRAVEYKEWRDSWKK